jgi:hypothetical protein
LEIYSREFKTENEFILTVSWSYLCSKLVVSRSQHIKKALLYCNERGRFEVKFNGKFVEIYIPKFKKYLDEFTLKKLRLSEQKSGVTPDKLRTNSEVTPENVRTEVDVDIDSTPLTPQGGNQAKYTKSFESWWQHYPSKVGKDAAYRSWKKIGSQKTATASQLIKAIQAQAQANHFRGVDGQDYIPNPATWLNQGRWMDELKKTSTPRAAYHEITDEEIYGIPS